MAAHSIPVRFRFRSSSMIYLLTIMQGAGLWKQEGLDVRDVAYTDDPLGAEDALMSGEIDFLFGNHVSPYYRLTRGYPLVCLAQTENWEDIWAVTTPEIGSLAQAQGKRVVLPPLILENGEFAGHHYGSRLLLLSLHGVNLDEVEYIHPDTVDSPIAALRDGKADLCFIGPDRAERARAAGLHVHELPRFPMVHSVTFTTVLPRIVREPELAERVIRVMARAVHFFKTRKEETLELLKDPVLPLKEGRLERLAHEYEDEAREYDGSLYPNIEAIVNVHRLASLVYPEARTVNPMQLWDMHPLRLVHASGFIDNLYAQQRAVTAVAAGV